MSPVRQGAPFLNPAADPHVAAFLRTVSHNTELETRIHPADEMYQFELSQPRRSPATAAVFYFHTGFTIFDTLRYLIEWRFGRVNVIGQMLDFASGFGRATRFLVGEISPRRLHVTEIDPAAVAFQKATFGVSGSVSSTDPNAFELWDSFDVITAWSFFSHLPAMRFQSWMDRLFRLLSPGGALIFSVHGVALLGAQHSSSEFVFHRSSETTRLDTEEYGTSYVTTKFVRKCAKKATRSEGILIAVPFGLCGFQDVYILMRPPVPALPDLRLPRSPWGMMDSSSIENGVVRVGGWASAAPDEPPPDVLLCVDDQTLDRSHVNGSPGCERRWAFEFEGAAIDPDAIIRLEAASCRGLTRIMVAETLRPYLGSSAR
jgi:SAM-dependent methyltransferase